MPHADTRNSLLIMGVYLKSEGYPNTLYRLRDLIASNLFHVVEINVPMWSEDTQQRHGFSRMTRNIWRAVFAHCSVMVSYLVSVNRPERVYLPYPSVFVLFLLSWMPLKLRPRHVVADVFISLYDTIVLDRQLLKRDGISARVLKWIEKRAYVYADQLVVDTQQNAKFLSSLFNLPETKLIVVPLSIDEANFRHMPYHPSPSTCQILFVGTLVPLHGIKTILEAASLLSTRTDIHFKLIGDGQDAPLVEEWMNRQPIINLAWERAWQPSRKIAEEINHADICLGIFGAGDKTQRVCPFKVYAYAATGRAIVTGETDWFLDTVKTLTYEPFACVPVNDAAALAAKITQLADDQELRATLATSSHEFYQMHLGNRTALGKLAAFLST